MNQLVTPSNSEGNGRLPQAEYIDTFCRIYQKVNQTLKETSKTYENDLLLNFSDLEEIHRKTSQAIYTFKPNSVTLKINLEQAEGEYHIFKDFDSFKNHNTTSPYPTHNVFFEYKFIVFDNDNGKFENYNVSFRLSSRLAEFEKAQVNSPDFLVEMMSSIKTTVAVINVEYYDYVKARTFMAAFDEWVKGCTESQSSKSLIAAKKIAKHAPRVGSLFIIGLVTYLTVKSIPAVITDLSFVLKFIITYGSIFVFIRTLSNILLGNIRKKFNRNIALSYLKINKGDEKLIDRYKNQFANSIKSSVLSIILTITLGISTNFMYDVVKYFFN